MQIMGVRCRFSFTHQNTDETVRVLVGRLESELEEVRRVAIQGESVFAHELHRLSRVVEYQDKKDDVSLSKALQEIEYSSSFAKCHVEYLVSVIRQEEHRLGLLSQAIAAARMDKRSNLADRLSKELSKQEKESKAHIDRVSREVVRNLERNADASAKNIAKDLGTISANEEEFHNLLDMISDKVRGAIREVLED